MSTPSIARHPSPTPARVRYTLASLGEAMARVARQQEALGHTPEDAWYRASQWLYVLKRRRAAGADQVMAEHTADVCVAALNRANPPPSAPAYLVWWRAT